MNNDNQSEEVKESLNSKVPENNLDDVPDELFAPIGDKVIENPKAPNIEHNINDEDMSLEEEAEAVKKYELGEKSYNPKLKKYMLIVSIVIIILLGGLYYFFTSPKVVFYRGLNKSYKMVNKKIEEIATSSIFTMTQKNIITNKIGLSFESTIERSYQNKSVRDALEELKDFSVMVESHVNRKNKKITGSATVNSGIYKAIDFSFTGENNKMIIDMANTSNKPFSITWNGYSNLFNENGKTSKEWEEVTEKITKYTNTGLKDKEIVSKKETFSIDGIKKTYKKYSVSFSKEEGQTLLNTILNDSSINQNLQDILGLSNIKENSQRLVEKLSISDGMQISIYTKGLFYQTVGFEIEIKGDKKLIIEWIDDDLFKRILIQNDKQNIMYENNGKNGNFIISPYQMHFVLKNKEDKKMVYDYTLYKDKDTLFSGKITHTITSVKGRTDGLISMDMSLEENKKTVVTAKTEINYSTYIEDRMSSIDFEEVVDYETLSLKEKERIKNRFVKNSVLLKLENKLKAVSNMEVTDRKTTRYTYSYIDIVNRLLAAEKKKNSKFNLDGTYTMNQEGLIQNHKVIFHLDNERMLLYPDTISIQNEVTIYHNQIIRAKLKFDRYYVTYDVSNEEQPLFISLKAFK